MENTGLAGFFCRTATIALFSFAGMTTVARAQTTVIGPNGGVTVRNPNGTTTRITNGGVVTTGRTVHKVRQHSKVRVVRTAPLGGGNVSISGNSRTLTVTSKNGTVEVSGNNNRVTIKGRCEQLMVSGNHNVVRPDNVVSISATGNNNTIIWGMSPTRHGSPGITQTGSNNVISRRR